jgi:hypothetical protein
MAGVGLDFSKPMLRAARERFVDDRRITLVEHDLAEPLPREVSGASMPWSPRSLSTTSNTSESARSTARFSISSNPAGLRQPRARGLAERARPHRLLRRHRRTARDEDPSDRLLGVEPQLGWLRELGFGDVDCYWKWLEMALLVGVRPLDPEQNTPRPARPHRRSLAGLIPEQPADGRETTISARCIPQLAASSRVLIYQHAGVERTPNIEGARRWA